MTRRSHALDAVVVGSGPNGLAAALTLARAGLSVEVFEGADTAGGGCRTEQLTLPDFHHDVCSTIQSMIPLSPFFRKFDDVARAVTLCTPSVAYAHPLEDGRGAVVRESVSATSLELGADAHTYRRLFEPLVADAAGLVDTVLAPLRSMPRHPLVMAGFARRGLPSAARLVRRFSSDEVRALMAGVCAHAMLPLDAPLTSAFGLFLGTTAHAGGWPVVEGGSARLVDALVAALDDAGATVHLARPVRNLRDLPASRAVLFDTSAPGMVDVAGERLSKRFKSAVGRFRRAPGVFKVDWALSGPVPWRHEGSRRAGTVHLGGTFEEVAESEFAVSRGRHSDRPFCIVAQSSVVDPTRAPAGHHTLWAYCHVPNGSSIDMTERMEDQLERFAPGFRDLVLARAVTSNVDAETHNPNYLGGDIAGGAGTLRQTLFRPTVRWNNYRTGTPGLYLCSSSTPPGGGVHGMCGFYAASTVLRDFRVRDEVSG